jgi:uncharacterized membrane protein YbhN (UPF0104 family)
MKKLHSALLVLGILFFGYLVWRTGIGQLWRQLTSLGWGLIPLILSEGLAEMIHTLGWRHCLSGPHRSLPWARLFRIRMAGYALNYVTPTATLSGEVARAALLAAGHPGPEAVSGVLIGKVCFALAHLLFVIIGGGLILWQIQLPLPLWLGLLISGGLLGSGIITFLLLQKQGRLGELIRWLAARRPGSSALQAAAREISQVDEALRVYYRERPGDLAIAIGWHLLGFSLGILATWWFLSLVSRQGSLETAAAIWFVGMWFDLLTFAVPLNLGALEGSRILALKATGYNALLGMTYGVSLRLAQLCWAMFGLVSYALLLSGAMASVHRNPQIVWKRITAGLAQAQATPPEPASAPPDYRG